MNTTKVICLEEGDMAAFIKGSTLKMKRRLQLKWCSKQVIFLCIQPKQMIMKSRHSFLKLSSELKSSLKTSLRFLMFFKQKNITTLSFNFAKEISER